MIENIAKDIRNLKDNIVAGMYTPAQARAEINRLKEQYGESAFPPADFAKKPGPWSKAYLDELDERAISSEGYIEYMEEVSYSVHCRERRKRRLILGGSLVIIIAVIAVLIIILTGRHSGRR